MLSTHRLRLPLAVGATLLTVGPVQSETVVLTADRDNTLYQTSGGTTSNGAGIYLFVGRTGQSSNNLRRGLVRFDLSSIPSTATITGAQLTLRMSRTISGAQTIDVHRLLADWGEGTSNAGGQEGGGATATTNDATWLHGFFDQAPWSTAGGDYAGNASASRSVSGSGSYTWLSDGLVADVQAWLDDPDANFGWILIGNEGSTRTAKRFDSRQNATAANRPQLTLEFTVPNQAPVVAAGLPDTAVAAGDTLTLDLSSPAAFSDADGDALTYAAASSDSAAAIATVSGSSLAVRGIAAGGATVTVTATDPSDAAVSTSFAVSVSEAPANQAPVVAAGLPDTTVALGDTLVIDLSAVFSDADGDALDYAAVSGAGATATAGVDGATLTVVGVGAGSTQVEVTASDPGGLEAGDAFDVTVTAPNTAPTVSGTVAEVARYLGAAAPVVDVADLFADADGDPLSLAATSSNEEIAGASVAGTEVTIDLRGSGGATVTVDASDGRGGTASLDIAVFVAPLVGDFDGSGAVDLDDFFEFADRFGLQAADAAWDPAFDIVASGVVDLDDFFEFTDWFGRTVADVPSR